VQYCVRGRIVKNGDSINSTDLSPVEIYSRSTVSAENRVKLGFGTWKWRKDGLSSILQEGMHKHGHWAAGWEAISWKFAGSIPEEVNWFLQLPNPSGRTKALELTQPLREMSTRKLPEWKGQPARKAWNFTAICEPIV
jgi:hypothetical protein